MEPLEIKFSKEVLLELKQSMNELKEASLADGQSEPSLSLFVIKQV